ncbi:MAG: Holliday junction resolvase RuvX [Tissierellia bacterium]|nr:Holliday junction resolvase RuvX [Tissierellia bacterium]
MERIMGLDLGDMTIGVAISDPLLITAQGLKTIRRESKKKDIAELKNIIEKYNITKIVIGFPKNMNNTVGPQGKKVLDFVEELKKRIDIEIILEDERLTTAIAEKALIRGDVSREKRKKVIDTVAATYILQTYLDRRR